METRPLVPTAPQTAVRTKIQVLWTTHRSLLHTKLSFNVIREICDYFGDIHFFPWIQGKVLRVYYLSPRNTINITLNRTFPGCAAYCGIDLHTLIYLGGTPERRETFLLSLIDYQSIQVESMGEGRRYPGIIKQDKYVYVFGGRTDSMYLTSCEKFDLETRSWTKLLDMHYPRYFFSPCLYEGEVYLPDVKWQHRALETFNISTERFTVLPMKFPAFNLNSVSFIVSGELIVLTLNKQMGRWRIGSNSSFQVSTLTKKLERSITCCPPVVIGKKVYWTRDTGELCLFDYDTNAVDSAD